MVDGLVSNLGQMLQASIIGGNVMLKSIVNKSESATVTEVPTQPRDENEKSKPVIKSNVLIKTSTSKPQEDHKKMERKRILSERGDDGEPYQELFNAIPDMSTLGGNVRHEPHPHWLGIQTVTTPPHSPRSSLSVPEVGEVVEYDSEENWDEEAGKLRRRLKPKPMVSRKDQPVKTIINNRDETNEMSEVNVEALIEQKATERVDSFLKEHSRLNESLNSHVNLTDKIQVEVIEKHSGTNQVYKLTANSKFDML